MENAKDTISRIRAAMGDSLSILGHHYQSDDVIAYTDIRGDSLELARKINALKAEHIVFCGVFFMAESAAILRRPDQKIHIPEVSATCPMADMAEAGRVRETLDILQKSGRKIIPLTYVNSSAAVKGVVGEYDGSVCTSANARIMLEWALKQGDAVLFLPDQHLGNNTANTLGIPKEKRFILPKDVIDGQPRLSVDPTAAENKQLILWPGYCPIHDEFTLESVRTIRRNEPEAKIVVHPECDPAIVDAADGNGSTTYLIKYANQAPEGSTIYIGTETNLVKRLASLYQGQKIIKPLHTALCEDMGKITVEKLACTLETLESATPVTVQNDIREPAKLALERMLAACS
ncbi:quinolinate synthase NadA [Pseudodesulfovibrio sp. S3]|uniref:quinolinate synthase NadA n=1 Tax=unclassified Pseudodesulfovibrio TaxID=2661612 RepID=UPI000FEB9E0F|nr:quinolinate synthase NadA [Pseudodesulfovibrio sp. S3]MCJ2163770.1 quinolinate synthase NadA [Pseudodesulfovibrio sp. S3-i]RWU05981.1 quinolinate synthase NadA [Pseudodesulfovibrio sp. S3]